MSNGYYIWDLPLRNAYLNAIFKRLKLVIISKVISLNFTKTMVIVSLLLSLIISCDFLTLVWSLTNYYDTYYIYENYLIFDILY